MMMCGSCYSIKVETDDTPNGILFNTFEDVYLQNKTIKLMYSMNISIIDTVLERINETLCNCKQNIRYELKKYKELNSNNFIYEGITIDRSFHMIDTLILENKTE